MKNKLEHIDEVFKQAFDGFEANVDPSVWNNVQNSITSGSSPQIDPATTSVASKSVALKIVAGIIAIGSIATGTYFVLDNPKEEKKELVAENLVLENVSEEGSNIKSPVVNIQTEKVLDNSENKNVEESVIVLASSSENNELIQTEEIENITLTKDDISEESKELENPKEVVNVDESPKEIAVKSEIENKTNPTSTVKEEAVLRGAIIASATSGKAPLGVVFNVDGENILSYSWDFGDNSEISNEESSYHTYETPGTYKVKLIIIDKNANSKSFIKFIKVENNETSSLGIIPNAFTPNGDGVNDAYKVTGENIVTFNAKIMTQDGKMIYTWNSINGFWDGTDMAGNKLPYGTYYLDIQAIGSDGEPHNKRTAVHLLSKEL